MADTIVGVRRLLFWLAGSLAAAACAADSPRNVILFLGDGMGVSTVTAARILEGQQRGRPGEENALSFEKFPNVALIKTYNTNSQVADSAGTMSAIMTGKKTRIGVINVAPRVALGDCAGSRSAHLTTLLEEAEAAGMATGIVSTANITHATPAATYAHTPHRDWENDAEVPEEHRERCADIARQLVEFPIGDGLDVALGGGRAMFMPTTETDPEDDKLTGLRQDGRNLVREWLEAGDDRHYVWNARQFEKLRRGGQVLGLFEHLHMEFDAQRAADEGGEPSLEAMTSYAIDHLRRNKNGYFLMVEAGRIDHGHHFGIAYRALTDTIALSDAVRRAVRKTKTRDTLIVVTADHSHTLTISGYPSRGNPILGHAAINGTPLEDRRGRPYTTLSYANGPGYRKPAPAAAMSGEARQSAVGPTAPDYQQVATWPLFTETHAGEDVAAYALGPNAEQLRGVMEQNKIYDVMRGALTQLGR